MVSSSDSSDSKKTRRSAFSGGFSKTSHNASASEVETRILSDSQLSRLKEHKYNCLCASMLDPYLQPYWNWLVRQLPLWMAPNLITILGLLLNVLTSLILVLYSPDCNQQVPSWSLVLCAIGLFLYQSLDAIDGKQARRTKSSSPLGELFDHGCDSISTVFVSLGVCVACRLGDAPRLMFLQSFMAVTLFYCAHWQTYVTGTLRFGYFDVTEAQVAIMIIHLTTAAFGGDFWTDVHIPIFGLPLYTVYVAVALSGAIYTLFTQFHSILWKGAGKNGSSIAGTSVLSPVIPLALVVIPAILIAVKSESDVYRHHPAAFILTFGLIAAKITNRLVVAHMTKSEMDYFDFALIGPFLLALNQYFDVIVEEKYILYLSLIMVTFELCRYSRKVCLEICNSLQIRLFQIDVSKIQENVLQPVYVKAETSVLRFQSSSGRYEENSRIGNVTGRTKSKK